jgi:hypothetical protein
MPTLPPLREVWRDALREALVHGALRLLPRERRRAIDRRLRGREEARKLALADAAIVSYGKSGRTWLRVLLSRVYTLRHGLPSNLMLEFDNLHRLDRAIPKLLFTHANYIRDWTGEWQGRRHFHGVRTVLLIRHPCDVAVSQYHQWRHRMRPWKTVLNRYPPPGAPVELEEFVRDPAVGLPAILAWLELFERELPAIREHLLVRYEDLRRDTAGELARLLAFLGTPASAAEIAEAVAFARLDNMRRLEAEGALAFHGIRARPRDPADPRSFKTRKGMVGGWRAELGPEAAARIEAWLGARGPLPFGYTLEATPTAGR